MLFNKKKNKQRNLHFVFRKEKPIVLKRVPLEPKNKRKLVCFRTECKLRTFLSLDRYEVRSTKSNTLLMDVNLCESYLDSHEATSRGRFKKEGETNSLSGDKKGARSR